MKSCHWIARSTVCVVFAAMLAACNSPAPAAGPKTSSEHWSLTPPLKVNPSGKDVISGAYLRPSHLFVSPQGTPWVLWSPRGNNRLLLQTIDKEKNTASEPIPVFDEKESVLDYPTVIFDSANNLAYAAVWQKKTDRAEMGNKYVLFSRSRDGGKTWSASKALSSANGAFGPLMVQDQKGGVYVIWKDERNGLSDLFFNRSRDFGETWLAKDVRLNSGAMGKVLAASPTMVCDDQGGVYVAFSETPDGKPGAIFFTASRDYGTSWSKPVRVNDSDGFHMDFPQMVRHPDGRLALAWAHSGERNFAAVYFDTSADSGKTWGADRILYSSAPSAMEYLTMFGASDGFLGIIWVDQVANEVAVVFKSSNDFGAGWAGDNKLQSVINKDTENRRSRELRAEYDGRQTVGATWSEYALLTSIIRGSFSLDRGATWLDTAVELSPAKEAESDYRFPQVAVYDDQFFVIFQRLSGDNTDIIFRSMKMVRWSGDRRHPSGPGKQKP